LQESFALLYQSNQLGVVIANEVRGVLDANDEYLRMVGHTRDEMLNGQIDWWAMTPEKDRPLDVSALKQMREYGTCVPYEKEYVLRDGSKVPFMMGAVRLADSPLTWAAYTVDLSHHRKAFEAEQRERDLHAKATVLNQLAHEINNPLAALTFLLHLLGTRLDLATDETKNLLRESNIQLDRIADAVRAVVSASEKV
jgi:PAS domain S-box-containing protein